MTSPERLALYTRVAERSASTVIAGYSTSFRAASRLLAGDVRQHVENIYALVRIADEIVDGAAEDARLDRETAAQALDELERDTATAIERGYSANLVLHAFAGTARQAGFGTELTAPFYASMRMDLTRAEHDAESFERYVYGSAEVVGLMCLRVFERGRPADPARTARLEEGARRLGAAFQKVNFLRDLAADFEALGRSYFPGVDVARFTEADKHRILDDIDADLHASAATIPELPASARRAVALAQGVFTELAERIRRTPADQLLRSRVRVPDPVKLRIAAAAAAGWVPKP
ncbi:phytoene/squalene synthase family protein [Lysobacter korlensis]|uniref:Phytoene/squalene synthase family protein n=1 Tax=Lysobacter korlensis TaxID=553636 RepID=A0ABV6RTU1_9GAMM